MATQPAITRRRIVSTRLGRLLLEQRLITRQQLDEALALQRATGRRLGQILLERDPTAAKDTMEEGILVALITQYGFPRLPLENFAIDREIVSLIPRRVARHHCLMPVSRLGSSMTVAMANPLDAAAIHHLEALTHCAVLPLVSTPSEIQKAIDEHYAAC